MGVFFGKFKKTVCIQHLTFYIVYHKPIKWMVNVGQKMSCEIVEYYKVATINACF